MYTVIFVRLCWQELAEALCCPSHLTSSQALTCYSNQHQHAGPSAVNFGQISFQVLLAERMLQVLQAQPVHPCNTLTAA